MIQAFIHYQAAPSLAWTITHPFDDTPVGDVTSTVNGSVIKVLPKSIKSISETQVLVEFNAPLSGWMRLVGNVPNASTGTSGAGSIDPGALPPTLETILFFDEFTGVAGTLEGRVTSGFTWVNDTPWELDGAGKIFVPEAPVFSGSGLSEVQIINGTPRAGGFFIENVFASVPRPGEEMPDVNTFMTVNGGAALGVYLLPGIPTASDLTIQIGGSVGGNSYQMALPAVNEQLTVRASFLNSGYTLKVNGISVLSGPMETIGYNIDSYVLGLYSILSSGVQSTMKIDSIKVGDVPGGVLALPLSFTDQFSAAAGPIDTTMPADKRWDQWIDVSGTIEFDGTGGLLLPNNSATAETYVNSGTGTFGPVNGFTVTLLYSNGTGIQNVCQVDGLSYPMDWTIQASSTSTTLTFVDDVGTQSISVSGDAINKVIVATIGPSSQSLLVTGVGTANSSHTVSSLTTEGLYPAVRVSGGTADDGRVARLDYLLVTPL